MNSRIVVTRTSKKNLSYIAEFIRRISKKWHLLTDYQFYRRIGNCPAEAWQKANYTLYSRTRE
jgi:hypothetical protein